MTPLQWFIVLWLICFNCIAFILMGLDKRKAKRGLYRIPERRLFLFTALFGSAGGLLGMYLFRHKTRHWKFRIGFPALFIVHVVLIVLLLRYYGLL